MGKCITLVRGCANATNVLQLNNLLCLTLSLSSSIGIRDKALSGHLHLELTGKMVSLAKVSWVMYSWHNLTATRSYGYTVIHKAAVKSRSAAEGPVRMMLTWSVRFSTCRNRAARICWKVGQQGHDLKSVENAERGSQVRFKTRVSWAMSKRKSSWEYHTSERCNSSVTRVERCSGERWTAAVGMEVSDGAGKKLDQNTTFDVKSIRDATEVNRQLLNTVVVETGIEAWRWRRRWRVESE